MAQTVIGFFDNASEAQQAVEQLVSNGFSRASIDIAASSGSMTSSGSSSLGTTDTSTSSYGTSNTSSYNDDNDGFGDKVGRFFSNLFDSDDDRSRYSSVASRSTTVTVHTQSVAEAERAADLLDRYGAVDVDQRDS